MKKVTLLIAGTLAATTLFAGASAYAMRGGHGMDGEARGPRMTAHIAERLELDEGQAAALEALQTRLAETRELMRGSDMRTQIQELLTAETFDQDAALALINERAQTLQNQAPDVVSAAAVFFDGLTAEQKTQLQTLMEKRGKRGRFGGHRGH